MSFSSELAAAIEEPDLRPQSQTQGGGSEITQLQRMLSACSGSLLTSFLVTPFDVVRIRLQQQVLLAPAAECCRREVWWNDTRSCVVEAPCTTRPFGGTLGALATIARTEGPATLWRGLSLTLLMAAPSNIVYLTGYELLRDSSPIAHPWLNPLLCGALARIIAGTCIGPIELLKTRLQSVPGGSQNMLKSMAADMKKEVIAKGPSVLFRGLSLTLWRDVPFSGIYWASYEFFRSKLSASPQWQLTHNKDSNLFIHSFISGSISGGIAACATNPFDVGKTRLQISSDAGHQKEKNVAKFMLDIARYEGFTALYVGLAPRLLKVAPSCAIMISSYELSKRFFSTTPSALE